MKRAFDFLVALFAVLLLSPVMLITALGVRIILGKPVIFNQARTGYRGRCFKIYKFRSMAELRDSAGELLPDYERLGRVGKLLRHSSLDELPQLLNVIRGDMSLVGPRPLLPEYLPLYNKEQARRHEVRPGITGWAQIHGRNALSWEDRFKLDVWYVDNGSFWLDLKIILATVLQMFHPTKVSGTEHEPMPKFTGGGIGKAGKDA